MSSTLRLLVVLVGIFVGQGVWAGKADEIRDRIAARKPAVDALKAKRFLGENHRGYLEPRHSLFPEQEKLMSDENHDRRELYKTVAGEKGMRMEEVGREQASENAFEAKRGTWIQDEYGEWYVKT